MQIVSKSIRYDALENLAVVGDQKDNRLVRAVRITSPTPHPIRRHVVDLALKGGARLDDRRHRDHRDTLRIAKVCVRLTITTLRSVA